MECISNGSLAQYEKVRKEQYEILETSEEKIITIPDVAAPYPLFHVEVKEDGAQNHNWVKYYKKDRIKVETIH